MGRSGTIPLWGSELSQLLVSMDCGWIRLLLKRNGTEDSQAPLISIGSNQKQNNTHLHDHKVSCDAGKGFFVGFFFSLYNC